MQIAVLFDLHKVLLKSNAGVESTHVALDGFETVGGQNTVGWTVLTKHCDCIVKSRGKLKAPEWSNRKNEDAEDRREILIRDGEDNDSVRRVFPCTARFGVRFGTSRTLHAK